ncbi:MAG: glycosyltransferase family 2 protein [Steroidobacteraceae bacterium]
MTEPLLTVVLAAKDPEPRLLVRCLSSFSALGCVARIQMLLMLSGKSPVPDREVTSAFASFDVNDTPAQGVYAAYNAGIDHAHGQYVLFFGIDDIALPGMDATIADLEHSRYDLYAAACYMQGKGIRQPSSNRRSLIKANWCQQSLFYARAQFADRRFDLRYPVQADHKLNIDLVSNPTLTLGISGELVAYFSSGGVSSRRHDLNFIRDFPTIVGSAYGRPLGLYWAFRQRLSIMLRGSLESRYCNPQS